MKYSTGATPSKPILEKGQEEEEEKEEEGEGLLESEEDVEGRYLQISL
jgi:hypothetical protein